MWCCLLKPVGSNWTYFACITPGSALLPAAFLFPRSLHVPLRSLSLLWEGLGLWVGQRRRLGALVERGRGPGWGLQEAADGRMVQHCRVTLRGMLGHRGHSHVLGKAEVLDFHYYNHHLQTTVNTKCLYDWAGFLNHQSIIKNNIEPLDMEIYLWELCYPSVGVVISNYACP